MGKRGAKLTKLTDFEFKWDPEEQGPKGQTVDQMKQVFESLVSASKEREEKGNRRLRKRPKRLKK